MARATSKSAYMHITETGKASTKRSQIMDYVSRHPGCTRADIARHVPGMTINCCAGRVRELLDSGVLIENGCTHDPITGRSVNLLFVNTGEVAA